jgi:hypothetical protein
MKPAKFNPAALPGPSLTALPTARYYELRALFQTIEKEREEPGPLLEKLTGQLSAAILDQLQRIVRGEGGYDDKEIGAVRAVLAACGGMRFEPNVTEDSFLAMAWLEVADRALENMEAGPLLTLTALWRTRDDAMQ